MGTSRTAFTVTANKCRKLGNYFTIPDKYSKYELIQIFVNGEKISHNSFLFLNSCTFLLLKNDNVEQITIELERKT